MIKKTDSESSTLINKDFILKAYSFRFYYIGCIIVTLLTAFLINKYSSTVYEISSIISPVENQSASLAGSDDLFTGLGAFAQTRNLENDINSLTSFSLVASTLSKLNLEIGYFRENNKLFKQTKEIYDASPFIVSIDKSHIQPIYNKFYVEVIDNNSYRLVSSGRKVSLYNYVDNTIVSDANSINIDTICKFNETISNKFFKLSISNNKDFTHLGDNNKYRYYFEFYHLDFLTKQYLRNLSVMKVNPRSSLIKIVFTGKNTSLINNFLNKFIDTYLEDNLSKKNKIAVNTINFIDSQIAEITDSLALSESKLRDYRSANQVMDLSYQGQRAFEQMTQIETDRANLQIQIRYYNYILDYFNKNKDMAGLAPPSSANVVDPIMNQLIMDLLELNSQRSTILSNNNEKNLFLGQIENKIKLQTQAIVENVSNNLNTLNLSLNELNYRSDKLSREISKLPKTELNMVSIQRKFNLSDAIYTFMLQKRSEAAITMASNYPDYEILEPARTITSVVVSPKKTYNYLLSFFLGFLLPTIFLLLKDFFNENITGIKDIERIQDRPVLSVIYSSAYKNEAVVAEAPGSSVAESFRNLRSSLFLKLKAEHEKIILVTSSQPQDGKSFVSSNLAASIAAVGYKTIILDCDLRRPTIHTKLKEENSMGLTNYMTNKATIDDIICKTYIENLWFIPSGPILPNPSELIESGKLDDLIVFLKKEYDYIIIDTTPVGVVADATLIMNYASQILFVCRNNITRKDILTQALAKLDSTGYTNYDIILNDLNLKKSAYGRYNSYYRKE